ncbi:MAG: CsbD family protein [Rhabdochlamydiaceae bacterium]
MSDLEGQGKVDEVKGKARKVIGSITDDKGEEIRGEAEVQKGKAKQRIGKALEE